MTSAPRTGQFSGDTATSVGFCHPRNFRILLTNSAESSSQSTMTRSVLPSTSRSNASEELKQMLVAIERLSSNLFMTETTPVSRETNKHSKAISDVTFHLSTKGRPFRWQLVRARPGDLPLQPRLD